MRSTARIALGLVGIGVGCVLVALSLFAYLGLNPLYLWTCYPPALDASCRNLGLALWVWLLDIVLGAVAAAAGALQVYLA